MNRTAWPLWCGTVLLCLGACGKNEAPAGSAAAPRTTATGKAPAARDDGKQAATKKYNEYVDAYNKLIGPSGLSETFERYRKTDFQKIKPQANIDLAPGWVDIALERFRKARTLPGRGIEALDQAADALIPVLDKLVVQMKDLDLYYESRAYRNDAMARGRTEDPILIANFTAATAAGDRFRQALDKVQAERMQERLSAMKADGDMVGYQTTLALSQAEPLIEIFNRPDDLANPALLQRADAIVATLEKTLVEQRAAFAAAKTSAESSGSKAPRSANERIASSLTTMIGSYRDLKSSRSASAHKSMVDNYNRAVDSANMP